MFGGESETETKVLKMEEKEAGNGISASNAVVDGISVIDVNGESGGEAGKIVDAVDGMSVNNAAVDGISAIDGGNGGEAGDNDDVIDGVSENNAAVGGISASVSALDGKNGGEAGNIDDDDGESESSDDDNGNDESSSTESSKSSSSEEEEEDDDREESMDGDAEEVEEGEIKEAVAFLSEDDDEEVKGPIRSKNEAEVLPPVPQIEVSLEPHHQMLTVGYISSILEEKVIVDGSLKHDPLNEGSILWIGESRSPLGIVDEIFGPVKNPYYIVRYNCSKEVPVGINIGTGVSFVKEFATCIFNEKELYKKGYDASGKNDEEVDDEFEFSDDEKETEYKRSLRQAKRGSDDKREKGQEYAPDKRKSKFKGVGVHRGACSSSSAAPRNVVKPLSGSTSNFSASATPQVLPPGSGGLCNISHQSQPLNSNPLCFSVSVPMQQLNLDGPQFLPSQPQLNVPPPQYTPQPNPMWPHGFPPQQQQQLNPMWPHGSPLQQQINYAWQNGLLAQQQVNAMLAQGMLLQQQQAAWPRGLAPPLQLFGLPGGYNLIAPQGPPMGNSGSSGVPCGPEQLIPNSGGPDAFISMGQIPMQVNFTGHEQNPRASFNEPRNENPQQAATPRVQIGVNPRPQFNMGRSSRGGIKPFARGGRHSFGRGNRPRGT